jgi:small subunit ribosomal protein S6
MFVIDQNKARQDFEAATQVLRSIIEKNEGRVVKSELWEDRKLAYPIRGQRKAAYVLMHFEAPSASIQKIERGSKLEESVLRVLITKDADGLESYVRQEDRAGLDAPVAPATAPAGEAPVVVREEAPKAEPKTE